MIYIKYELETTTKAKVVFTHYMPFDETYGLHKTEEELEQEGILVDTLPEPEGIENTLPILYVNPETKELWYEYTPYTPVLTPEQEIANLKAELQRRDVEMLAMKDAIDFILFDSLAI